MMSFSNPTLLVFAALILVSCGSSDTSAADAPTEAETIAQQRALVENAVRRAYEAEGAEVTEIAMELSPDGSRYTGRAEVRDPATGADLTVDCRYFTDVTGAPQLSCDRVTDEE